MPIATELSDENQPSLNALNPAPPARLPLARRSRAVARRATESVEYSALVARATNDAVRDWDVTTGRLSWPQGLNTLLGYEAEEIAPEIKFWQEKIHPDDRLRIDSNIRDALAHAERWAGEYRFRRADGLYLVILERACIVRDEVGAAVRFVGSLMDVTARRQLQDQLRRSQKMDAFGQLAAGVGHDFNNFLTTILGYSDLLLSDHTMTERVADHLNEIRSAAGRAAALTGQLLAFSRRHPLDPRILEVNALISKLEREVLGLLGENIFVLCQLHHFEGGGHVKADPGQLTQIILNLIVNARDAMENGGRLTLTTGSLEIDDGRIARPACELKAGEYITISVSDSGCGMSDEVKSHLFEPFFTTKEGSHGGLGLATTYGIVRQSGGQVCVESTLGRGTTVTIYLPRVPAPKPAYKKVERKKLPTGSETVLVLEDDVSVRHLSVRVLRNLGYHVIEAANGDDAKQLISAEDQRQIDLLITDMVMPQMSGRRFADWLTETSPQTRVLFISGYLEESLHPRDRRDGEMFFLQKPFDSGQLAVKVREALDATPA